MLKVRIVFLLLFAVALGGAGFYFSSNNFGLPTSERVLAPATGVTQGTYEIEEPLDSALEEKAYVSFPMRRPAVEEQELLTVQGIVAWTNAARRNAGLPALTQNNLLADAAAAKVKDMFAQEYFEHVSPDGVSAADLVKQAGYTYVLTGENLALGGYENDEVLVQAWMESPGHRENILRERFTEIGVAVGRGVFNGDEVWMAVQEFGLPRSACPSLPAWLKGTIDAHQEELDQLEAELADKKEELDGTKPKNSSLYRERVDAYNELVNVFNALALTTKELIDDYNQQVHTLNACLEAL